jgi:hypothetical protein
MIVLTYTFIEPIITQPILNLHFPIGAKYTLCFTYLIKQKKSIKNMEKKENPSKENMNMSAWKNISWTKGQIWLMIKKISSSPLPLHLTHKRGHHG